MGSAIYAISEGACACGRTSQGVVIEVALRGANAGSSVCTNYPEPEHISNQKRESATRSRRKLTLLSRAQMACLHSTAMPSIRWVIRPSGLVLGVFASISGARPNAKPVQDEEQQRLDRRESPSDGVRDGMWGQEMGSIKPFSILDRN